MRKKKRGKEGKRVRRKEGRERGKEGKKERERRKEKGGIFVVFCCILFYCFIVFCFVVYCFNLFGGDIKSSFLSLERKKEENRGEWGNKGEGEEKERR